MTRVQKAFKLADQGLSISKAMLQAGYGPGYAKNPHLFKRTDQWQKMLAEKLPDDDLLVAHRNALQATKWNDFTGEREADHNIRLKAAVEGYKLKGKLMENNGNTNTQVNIVLGNEGYMPPNNVLGLKPTLTTRPLKPPKSKEL